MSRCDDVWHLLLLTNLVSLIPYSLSVTLYAPFDAIGLKGNISFIAESDTWSTDQVTKVSVNLLTTESGTRGHKWAVSIHSNPVFFGTKGACSKQELGQVLVKLTDKHGLFELDSLEQNFLDRELELTGPKSIWSRSILIQSANSSNLFACANIFHDGQVRTAEASFTRNIGGAIVFLENELGETFIHSNLYQIGSEYKPATKYDWKLMVTDILDSSKSEKLSKCSYLNQVLDPDNIDDASCSSSDHSLCKMGDLTRKHGQATVGSANNRYSKVTFVDTALPISTFLEPSSSRQVYIVIYEKKDRVLACARVRQVLPREVRADVSMDGVKGYVRFSQRYKTDPTVVTVNLSNLMGRGKWYHVHEFPVPVKNTAEIEQCSASSVGGHWNPFGIVMANSPASGTGTVDQYEVGDLSGKFGPLTLGTDGETYFGVHVDMNLPLFGVNTISGRSLVIHRPDGSRWICASIGYPAEIVTLEASFRYPVVGQAIFRQMADDPLSETSVQVDLSYNDATVNSTDNHAWKVHTFEPGLDFYNYSRRCASTGDVFNPYQVETNRNSKCSTDNPSRCPLGDLSTKSRKIGVAAYKGAQNVQMYYVDTMLPLSGPDSIHGRSLVVYDDHGPVLRGNRMSCTIITKRHPLIATVKKWARSTGIDSNVTGHVTMFQDSLTDVTRVKVDFHGLNSLAGGYHVHEVWVPQDRDFPCSGDSVYNHYNPLKVDVSVGPLPGAGTVDQYEVGDLSGKFGTLDYQSQVKGEYLDYNLPLHGMNSVIGRSVVVHKKHKGERWVCGTVTPVLPKVGKNREIVAIAAFDDPRHLVQGYIRFRQIVYGDGSLSTTWVEIDLRHQGVRNLNVTHGHNWAIFVNQVGADAYNDFPPVKCLASGFRWNPFLSDSTNKHYAADCSKSNPWRCEMGDLSGRHGPLTIGDKRLAVADDNLPMAGNFSVLSRSVVIFHKDGSSLKMACANLKIDQHLVTNMAVKRHPTFSVASFMETMRQSLNLSESMVVPDLSATKYILDGECIQLGIHFYGVDATKNQDEFSNLLNFGNVRKGPYLIKTHYKPCRSLDELNAESWALNLKSLSLPLVTLASMIHLILSILSSIN